jgi:hypothetical protein
LAATWDVEQAARQQHVKRQAMIRAVMTSISSRWMNGTSPELRGGIGGVGWFVRQGVPLAGRLLDRSGMLEPGFSAAAQSLSTGNLGTAAPKLGGLERAAS